MGRAWGWGIIGIGPEGRYSTVDRVWLTDCASGFCCSCENNVSFSVVAANADSAAVESSDLGERANEVYSAEDVPVSSS